MAYLNDVAVLANEVDADLGRVSDGAIVWADGEARTCVPLAQQQAEMPVFRRPLPTTSPGARVVQPLPSS